MIGDHNTNLFHSYINFKQVNKPLTSLKINGILSSDHAANKEHVLNFYSFLFSVDHKSLNTLDSSLIYTIVRSLVLNEDNVMLLDDPSLERIKSVVFCIDHSRAPDPNGYTGIFLDCLGYCGKAG